MFVDTLTYVMHCQKKKLHFNFASLQKNTVHHVVFYKSDCTTYIAHSYKFKITGNNCHLMSHEVYTSDPKAKGVIKKSLPEFMSLHKKAIICISHLSEHEDFPFAQVNVNRRLFNKTSDKKIPFAHKLLYFYSVPVVPEHFFSKNYSNCILHQFCQFWGFDLVHSSNH